MPMKIVMPGSFTYKTPFNRTQKRPDAMDLQFQSTKTFAAVLSKCLPNK